MSLAILSAATVIGTVCACIGVISLKRAAESMLLTALDGIAREMKA